MKTIRIIPHGYLKELIPQPVELAGESVADIIKGLCKVTGGALDPKPGEPRHCLRIPGYDSEQKLYEPIADDVEEIHIYPNFFGGFGGKGGFMKIVLGAVLIAASFFMPAAITGLSLLGSTVGSMMFNFGLSLVLGGLLEFLSPAPQLDLTSQVGANDPAAARYFGADRNTVKIGTRIPLVYGLHEVYGHYLSFNVTSSHVA